MHSSLLTCRSAMLTWAAGLMLAAPGMLAAQQPTQNIQPIPESQPVGQQPQNQQYIDSMINYGHCPSCRGTIIDRGGWGHCEGCRRNGRIAPGTGWCAPGKVPVARERVEYWKYYPNYWSGYGPGPVTPFKPMVYTPTDTTQLGFYYQHAPSWHAQPWRVPGPPHPAYWHNRYCGRCQQGQPGHYGHVPMTAQNIGYSQAPAPTEGQPTPAMPGQPPVEHVIEGPQTIQLPEPGFYRHPARLSLLPDAPP